MTCTIWLLSYKYFVQFSVWTQCLLDGVKNANTKLYTSFWRTFSNDTDVKQQKFISQHVIQDETCIHNFDFESEQQSMQWTNESVKTVISLHCVTPFFSMSNANYWRPLKCTNIYTQMSYCACRVPSLATKRSKYYFNFILNRTRSGRELFDCPSYMW